MGRRTWRCTRSTQAACASNSGRRSKVKTLPCLVASIPRSASSSSHGGRFYHNVYSGPFVCELWGTSFVYFLAFNATLRAMVDGNAESSEPYNWGMAVFVGVPVSYKWSGAHLNVGVSIMLATYGKFSCWLRSGSTLWCNGRHSSGFLSVFSFNEWPLISKTYYQRCHWDPAALQI